MHTYTACIHAHVHVHVHVHAWKLLLGWHPTVSMT